MKTNSKEKDKSTVGKRRCCRCNSWPDSNHVSERREVNVVGYGTKTVSSMDFTELNWEFMSASFRSIQGAQTGRITSKKIWAHSGFCFCLQSDLHHRHTYEESLWDLGSSFTCCLSRSWFCPESQILLLPSNQL